MLRKRTLRILTVFAARDRSKAEEKAAVEVRRLRSLEHSSRTLAGYAIELSERRASDIRTGHDLLIHGQFLAATIKAQVLNAEAKAKTKIAHKAAFTKLGEEIERQRQLENQANEADLLERRMRDLRQA